MRWIKPALRNSISALLAGGETRAPVRPSLEPLRKAMIEVLGAEGAAANPQLLHRLQYADTIETLWFARSEMVLVLSTIHGEAAALDAVWKLAPQFEALLPQGLQPRDRQRSGN
jgi:hypothetical protein